MGCTILIRAHVFELCILTQDNFPEPIGRCLGGRLRGKLEQSVYPGPRGWLSREITALRCWGMVSRKPSTQSCRQTSKGSQMNLLQVQTAEKQVRGPLQEQKSQRLCLGHLFTCENTVVMPKVPRKTFSRLKKNSFLFQGSSLNATPYCFFTPTCVSTLELNSSITEDSHWAFLITVPYHFCPWVCRVTQFPVNCVYNSV